MGIFVGLTNEYRSRRRLTPQEQKHRFNFQQIMEPQKMVSEQMVNDPATNYKKERFSTVIVQTSIQTGKGID